MSGILPGHELGRLRAVALSPYDIKVLSTLVETGGEFPFYPERVAAETRAQHIAGFRSLAERDLIEIDEARSTISRWIVRLSDNGRAAYASLEKMSAKPRVEVQMDGETPRIVNP